MKKILSVVMMLTLALTFAACGGSDKDTTDSSDSKDTLVMATNAEFPPYEYYENGEVVGIDAEIAAAIADKLGMTLQIEDMDFDSILGAVQSGKADMGMAGMTVTEERQQSVNFTDTYAQGVQVVIVALMTSLPKAATGKSAYRPAPPVTSMLPTILKAPALAPSNVTTKALML